MIADLKELFSRMTAARYRRDQLRETELALVKAQIALEHWRTTVAYHKAVIATLEKSK